jgi:hypothetical protein
MECGIFDFHKVFSRAFGEGEYVAGGVKMEAGSGLVFGSS